MDHKDQVEVEVKEEVIRAVQPGTVKDVKIGLLEAVQHNVFFDAVLASIAYTLLEEAFAKSAILRDYKYEDKDMGTLTPEEALVYDIVSKPVTVDTMSLRQLVQQADITVSRIIRAVEGLLQSTLPGTIVAGTLRIHLVSEAAGTGRVGIHISAIKHTPKETA